MPGAQGSGGAREVRGREALLEVRQHRAPPFARTFRHRYPRLSRAPARGAPESWPAGPEFERKAQRGFCLGAALTLPSQCVHAAAMRERIAPYRASVPTGAALAKAKRPGLASTEPRCAGIDRARVEVPAGGRPLDPRLRAVFEPHLGFNFSQVRIHSDDRAAQSAQEIHALAYTAGRDVVFARGQYAPETAEGRSLLAHELTHVVQQGASGAVVQRQTSMPPECEDLLAQILARIIELKERFDALVQNKLNLPPTGPMSIAGHQQQFRNKQTNLRSMLNQWNFNGCGPGLPVESWSWATRSAPSPANSSPRTAEPVRDGTQIPVREVAAVAGIGIGLYIAYRVVRFLPSLFPPLWWTAPANALVP